MLLRQSAFKSFSVPKNIYFLKYTTHCEQISRKCQAKGKGNKSKGRIMCKQGHNNSHIHKAQCNLAFTCIHINKVTVAKESNFLFNIRMCSCICICVCVSASHKP